MALPINPRDLERMLKRLGITMESLEATRVTLELAGGRILEINEPKAVMLIRPKGQPPILYVIGELKEAASKPVTGETAGFTEEDVALVAEQAGVTMEEARKVLAETGGDIAEAILKLQERKSGSNQ